jgi:hypothetical protein
MDQAELIANELTKMINENQIPLSITEDIHELSAKLKNGEISLNNLEGQDAFIQDTIQEAMNRIKSQ